MTQSNIPKNVPARPLTCILSQFAAAHNMPFDMRWETLIRCYEVYNQIAAKQN